MNCVNTHKRLPHWLKKRLGSSGQIHAIKSTLRSRGLHTVCEEARCPNIGECFERGTATIMIMGDTCTRSCGFCNIRSVMSSGSHSREGGNPLSSLDPRLRGDDNHLKPLDQHEPNRVAEQVREMGLKHAVITSVTRDDLPDGGAAHFAKTIAAIRGLSPDTTIEVLTPDFEGREGDIRTVCNAHPDIFNHNVETVERLTPNVRNRAEYRRSLDVLRMAKGFLETPPHPNPLPLKRGEGIVRHGLIKSGLMLGLGETRDEVEQTLFDIKGTGCDIVTIGQYLRPSKNALPVAEYIEPETFREYEKLGLKLGFKYVFAGPFVRSSYLAGEVLLKSMIT